MIYKPDLETTTPEQIRTRQLERLNELLDTILPENRFYARKFDSITTPLDWDQFEALPFTTKSELVADQAATPPLGTICLLYTSPRPRDYACSRMPSSA